MHDKHSRDIAFLNNYAQERWEVRQWWHVCMCMYTVFGVNPFELLQHGGMTLDSHLSRHKIDSQLSAACKVQASFLPLP